MPAEIDQQRAQARYFPFSNLGTGIQCKHTFVLIKCDHKILACLLLSDSLKGTLILHSISDVDKRVQEDGESVTLVVSEE